MPSSNFFRVGQTRGVWHLITPEGKPFFSTGVCCVDQGTPRGKYDPRNPSYAAYRHYPNTEAWAKATVQRLKSWNFNTIGGWSDATLLKRGMPYTQVLHLGSSAIPAVPWGDLFSEETARTMDEVARKQILPLKDDPYLIGWFTDNELGWWDETQFGFFLKQPESNATRKVLINLLREHYRGDFALLQKDFETGAATRFEQLTPDTKIYRRPGGRSGEVIDKFTFTFASKYYQLTRDCVRRYDKNHLILGDRFAQWYPAPVARAAGQYMDVVSTNYGADWVNGELSHFQLERLHRLTGKPILITEYYFAAMENRSGNKNRKGGFPTVQTQKERATSFRRNLREMISRPYIIGAHWFQYTDEPAQGRGDGEDYNMGLVDVENRPYELMTAAATEVQGGIPKLRAGLAPFPTPHADREKRIPAAPRRVEEGLQYWDTDAAYLASQNSLPFGDLYATWNAQTLYLAVLASDFIDGGLYAGGKIPASERTTLHLQPTGGKPIRIRFGPGAPSETEATSDSGVVRRTIGRATTTSLLCAIPAERFGKKAFRSGDVLPLTASLVRHGGVEKMDWQVRLRLGG